MRKQRRRITRRKRKKSKSKKRYWLSKHLSAPVTNRFTRFTTYIIIVLELIWVVGVIIDILWFYLTLKGVM